MKKALVLILITFVLAGCSANTSRQPTVSDKTKASTPSTNSTIGQTKEIQITDTGMSLQIPNTWNPDKYKVYKEKNSIMVDYIEGSKTIPFFYITTYGKKGQNSPGVGMQMVVLTIDDWGFIVAYAHGSVIANAPIDYKNMSKDVQEIVSSLKIIDKLKLEQWYKENNTNNDISQ